VQSGSSTGPQLLAEFQVGGADVATLDINGKWTANGLKSPSFRANTVIYVDSINGNDSQDGSEVFPFQSI
jgi:hypothetical protein